nr:IS3 family transposase [Gordonia polyisoprenivorans]
MSVARFIADQRTNYRVPHAVSCRLLGVSEAWFYKWHKRTQSPGAATGLHTTRDYRRDTIDRAVAVAFDKARGLHGSPRLHADLRADGWTVTEKTVADSMCRQGLVARRIRRRNGLTRQDKTAPKFPDLLGRDFTAQCPDQRWVGDITEIRPRRASCIWPRSSTLQSPPAGGGHQSSPGCSVGVCGDRDGGRHAGRYAGDMA